MEAWTRNVNFTLAQEGRPTPVLVGNETTTKVSLDWLMLPGKGWGKYSLRWPECQVKL